MSNLFPSKRCIAFCNHIVDSVVDYNFPNFAANHQALFLMHLPFNKTNYMKKMKSKGTPIVGKTLLVILHEKEMIA